MNKQVVNSRVEDIFAHAAALDQDGRLRNTIYCSGRRIYILNQDYTILIRFVLRKDEPEFVCPVSFRANDYSSREFNVKDGRIEFVQREAKWISVKSCSTPDRTPEQVAALFQSIDRPEVNTTIISKDMLPLVNDELSHIEISCEGGKLKLVQRNIYNGTVLALTKQPENTLLNSDKLEDFAPIGIRTGDFLALYSFVYHLRWHFTPDVAWYENTDPKLRMTGVISQCLYDELGRSENGRQESQDGADQQSVDRPDRKPKISWKELQQGK
jgi:hypothetical protein